MHKAHAIIFTEQGWSHQVVITPPLPLGVDEVVLFRALCDLDSKTINFFLGIMADLYDSKGLIGHTSNPQDVYEKLKSPLLSYNGNWNFLKMRPWKLLSSSDPTFYEAMAAESDKSHLLLHWIHLA